MKELFQIKLFKDIPNSEWDNFIVSNSMGYINLLSLDIDPEDKNRKDISFAIYDNTNGKSNIIFAIRIYHIAKNKLNSRGFVISDKLSPKQRRRLKDFFCEYIDKYMLDNNIKYFEVRMPCLSENLYPDKHEFANPVMFMGFEPATRMYSSVIDLSKDYEQLFYALEETTRQAVRKLSQNEQYEVVESDYTQNDYTKLMELLKETYTRNNVNDQIPENLEKYFKEHVNAGYYRIFFLRDNSINDYVAAVAISIFKNAADYRYGASKTKKDIGINKYLLFSVINIIKKSFNDYGYFEVGGIFPWLREGKDKNIGDYKKSFGGQIHPTYTGIYFLPRNIKKQKILQSIFSVKNKYTAKGQYKVITILGMNFSFKK